MVESAEAMSRIGVILIDLQRSFTVGGWMQHIGPEEVEPIKQVFTRCAHVIKHLAEDIPLLLTRCLFQRKQDMEFVPEVADILQNKDYTEIIKPNTRIMDFDQEGVEIWMKGIKEKNIKTVVLGGCTTTSCVRQSSIQLQNYFGKGGEFEFIVDLNLCGARRSNYVKRCLSCMDNYMSGLDTTCLNHCKEQNDILMSPVDKAVEDMRRAGVNVVEQYDWSKYMVKV